MRSLTVVVVLGAMLALAGPAMAGAPEVVPAIREWQDGSGTFALDEKSRIVVESRELAGEAELLRDDLEAVSGLDLRVVRGSRARRGDVVLARGNAPGPEGYELEIGDRVELRGDEAGVFYGTRTVLQILRSRAGHRTLPEGRARDWPRQRERGYLLDVGRKYWSPDYIVQTIREMSYLRLNTLHFHFSDHNAFRLVSDRFPYLAAPEAYTKADIRRFEAVARRHHVDLIPEIEMPSHASAIIQAHPELGFECESMGSGTLDVTNPAARRFSKELIDEFAPLFDGPEFHIATDEYPTQEPQERCPELVRYAQDHGFGSTADVFVDYINEMNRAVRAHGKKMVIWNWWDVEQEPTIHPDRSIKVEAWTTAAETGDDHSPQVYLDMGYEVVVSPSDLLYVTQGFPLLPDPRFLYEEWEPFAHPRLSGYQISVWSDNAITRPINSFEGYLRRPREAMADRTWGGPRRGDVADFFARADAIGTPPGVPEFALPGTLSGTPYGTTPGYEPSTGFEKAFDGDPITFFLNAEPNAGHTGLELEQASAVSLIRYFASPGEHNLDRMTGGRFEGCTAGPASGCRSLATIDERPDFGWNEIEIADPGRYRWLRYVGPDGGYSSVAEIEFVAPSRDVTVDAPSQLRQLADNDVVTTYRNTTGRTVRDVRLELSAYATDDRAERTVRPRGRARFGAVRPGERVSTRWEVDVPLSAATGDYHLAGRAVHQDGRTGAFARSTLGKALEATLEPAAAALDPGDRQNVTLTIANSAARSVTVDWSEIRLPTANPGYTLEPRAGKVRVPAGGTASATLTAAAAEDANDITRPYRIDLKAAAGGQPEVRAGSVELRVRSRTHPFLSDLEWTEAESEWSTVTRDTYIGSGDPMTLNGVRYQKGLGTAGNSRISFDLGGRCSRFTATIGIDDAADFTTNGGTAHFFVLLDGRQVYESGLITREVVKNVDLDVTGVQTLSLVTDNAGDGFDHDANDWADARVTCG